MYNTLSNNVLATVPLFANASVNATTAASDDTVTISTNTVVTYDPAVDIIPGITKIEEPVHVLLHDYSEHNLY